MLILVLLLVATSAAAAEHLELEYEVRYGPLRIMAMRNTSQQLDDRYVATSEMRTLGMVGTLFPWQATARTIGRGRGTALAPEAHRTDGTLREARRTVTIDYGGDGAVRAEVAPPADSDERDPVPPDLQQATIDPLTAGLAAVASGCRGTLRVFDGRRRYDMTLSDLGEGELPGGSDGVYRGRARHCRAAITPLAGFWRRNREKDYRPSALDAWIASAVPGVRPVPVYLELQAPVGTVGIHLLRAAALPDGAAAPAAASTAP